MGSRSSNPPSEAGNDDRAQLEAENTETNVVDMIMCVSGVKIAVEARIITAIFGNDVYVVPAGGIRYQTSTHGITYLSPTLFA